MLEKQANKETSLLGKAYTCLAEYSDKLYQDLTDYINSSTFESKKNVVETFKRQLSSMNPKIRDAGDKYVHTYNKFKKFYFHTHFET